MEERKRKLKTLKIITKAGLERAEKEYRKDGATEIFAWAVNTPYIEIAENIIKDKAGSWQTPMYITISDHNTINGAYQLCRKAESYISRIMDDNVDLLSIQSYMNGNRLRLVILMRAYNNSVKEFAGFFREIGESILEEPEKKKTPGKLVIPDEIKNFKHTEEEINEYNKSKELQDALYKNCTPDAPFLNSIDKYVPHKIPRPEDKMDFIYDLKSNEQALDILTPYEQFNEVFRELMSRFSSGTDRYQYFAVLKGEGNKDAFMAYIEEIIESEYVRTGRMKLEDTPILLKKLNKALFQLYIVQDLIDDENVTDINITGPDSIRARVRGKTYLSNISFVDESDYRRFVEALAIRNNISLNIPAQTFSDNNDENYVLRFSISAEYANAVPYPYVHIRKVSRKKPLGNDLIKAGMFDEKVRDYILDCARTSRGVVFAGAPGSGKTVALNWFLEEGYESSADILVIQENNELFAYRKGVKIKNVVPYSEDKEPIDLEGLGKLALVEGANVFIIGEAKGAEICSAITLANSGCRTAITIHSNSSTETIDKMADLAMRGYANDYYQAKRSLKSFQTIVFMEGFAVKEISEIIGYDEEKKDMIYKCIYRKE